MQYRSAEEAVDSAVRGLFTRWMALQLTLENHPEHGRAQRIALELASRTTALALSRADIDTIAGLFHTAFDELSTDVEDGSSEQVAAAIVTARDAALRGDFAPAAHAARGPSHPALRARSVVQAAPDDDDEMDDPMEAQAPQPRAVPVVDDDGFTSVVRRGRH